MVYSVQLVFFILILKIALLLKIFQFLVVIVMNLLVMAYCEHWTINKILTSILNAIKYVTEHPRAILLVCCTLSLGLLIYCAKNVQFIRLPVPKNETIATTGLNTTDDTENNEHIDWTKLVFASFITSRRFLKKNNLFHWYSSLTFRWYYLNSFVVRDLYIIATNVTWKLIRFEGPTLSCAQINERITEYVSRGQSTNDNLNTGTTDFQYQSKFIQVEISFY